MANKFQLRIKKEDGSITIWFIFYSYICFLLIINVFICLRLLYYRHAVDAATEAAALCGASNVVEITNYMTNTSNLSLNREKADKESNWIFFDNLSKNGLLNAFVIKDFKTDIETDDDNRQWYKCTALVSMNVTGPINLQYVSSSKGEYNKKIIDK